MTNRFRDFGLNGPAPRDDPGVGRAWRWLHWTLFAFSLLAIPAFYVELINGSRLLQNIARTLYFFMFAGFAATLTLAAHLSRQPRRVFFHNPLDVLILIGAAVSIASGSSPWSSLEWILRLAFMWIVAMRIVFSLRSIFVPDRLLLLLILGAGLLALAGAGFYWLEPGVHSYAEGLWLAFESSATVGYGDMAPTTPASRVLAVFVVLSGYGMLSLVFASIAAMFVGQEEKLLRREMHRDIKRLHEEIAVLHAELRGVREAVSHNPTITRKSP